MNRLALLVTLCAAVALGACKKQAEESSGGGTTTTTESPASTESPATGTAEPATSATATTAPVEEPPAEPEPPAVPEEELEVESKDILSREPVTQAAQVQHILVGWADLAKARDPRAMSRTKAEADRLALDLLARVKDGMNMAALMSEHSEDPGSAQSGEPYAVRPTGDFVPEFEALALRLNVGEAGICRTVFGYHIIKRVQ